MEPVYTIAEVAKRTGLTQDTIRYYEKIKLLPPATRKENGQRAYSRQELDRVHFVAILKRTHMPLRRIQEYIAASAQSDYEACYQVLDGHRMLIEEQLAELTDALELMRYKLKNFQEIKDGRFIAEMERRRDGQ
ncbi:MerR family transcriptional regulator [Paenibacillus sp. FSL K6-1096]|uniref:MerR family transcriptional regulator n=1 Tax=Paenibacillus sp. FSL K6-1096 TaxID=2921460 RepID=UPI0030EB91E5